MASNQTGNVNRKFSPDDNVHCENIYTAQGFTPLSWWFNVMNSGLKAACC